jgi:hypothetical protein
MSVKKKFILLDHGKVICRNNAPFVWVHIYEQVDCIVLSIYLLFDEIVG